MITVIQSCSNGFNKNPQIDIEHYLVDALLTFLADECQSVIHISDKQIQNVLANLILHFIRVSIHPRLGEGQPLQLLWVHKHHATPVQVKVNIT